MELANAAYGQGQTQATPLQMALVAATIAERGSLMAPHVVDGLRAADGSVDRVEPSLWRQVLDRGRAESIARAMRAAVEGRLGRPYAGKAKIPGVPTAGKSGTAELGGSGRPDSWFIGFAPAGDPTIAVAVIVEGGGTGSEAAVPLGGQLMGAWLDLAATDRRRTVSRSPDTTGLDGLAYHRRTAPGRRRYRTAGEDGRRCPSRKPAKRSSPTSSASSWASTRRCASRSWRCSARATC